MLISVILTALQHIFFCLTNCFIYFFWQVYAYFTKCSLWQ